MRVRREGRGGDGWGWGGGVMGVVIDIYWFQ